MDIIDLGLKFGPMTEGNIPRYIGLHHSGGIQTAEAYHQMHIKERHWSGLGYNLIIDLDGTKYKGRDPKYLPAGILGHNKDSLHICAIGNFENMIMPAVQKESIKEAIVYYMALYPTIKSVKGHKELMSTDCPGKNYPLSDIRAVATHGLIKIPIVPTPFPINNKIFKLQHAMNAMNIRDDLGRKIVEDGWMGNNTKEALKKVIIRRGDKHMLVGWLQEQLGVTVDNVYGWPPYHETYDAIGKYQRDNHLVVDFTPGYLTLFKMAT
jgi:N-acetylmuramoyl-L-alanine amidase